MNLKISQKLIGSFLIVSLIFSLASFFSFKNMKDTNESYKYVIGTVSELNSITQSIQTEMAIQIGYYRAYMLYEKPEYKDKFNESNKKIDDLIKEGEKLSTLQETRDRLDSISKTNDKLRQKGNQVMNMLTVDRQSALDKGLKEMAPLSETITKNSDSLSQRLRKDIQDKTIKETENSSNSGLTRTLILSIIATLIALGCGIIISIFISKPIVKLNHLMKRVASGDLKVEKLPIKNKDEIFYCLGNYTSVA